MKIQDIVTVIKEAIDANGYISYSEEDANRLQSLLSVKFPFASVRRSTLGGESRASLSALVSVDSKEVWKNGIFQNSRFAIFSLSNGKIELISGDRSSWTNTRKTAVADVDIAARKICQWAPLK